MTTRCRWMWVVVAGLALVIVAPRASVSQKKDAAAPEIPVLIEIPAEEDKPGGKVPKPGMPAIPVVKPPADRTTPGSGGPTAPFVPTVPRPNVPDGRKIPPVTSVPSTPVVTPKPGLPETPRSPGTPPGAVPDQDKGAVPAPVLVQPDPAVRGRLDAAFGKEVPGEPAGPPVPVGGRRSPDVSGVKDHGAVLVGQRLDGSPLTGRDLKDIEKALSALLNRHADQVAGITGRDLGQGSGLGDRDPTKRSNTDRNSINDRVNNSQDLPGSRYTPGSHTTGGSGWSPPSSPFGNSGGGENTGVGGAGNRRSWISSGGSGETHGSWTINLPGGYSINSRDGDVSFNEPAGDPPSSDPDTSGSSQPAPGSTREYNKKVGDGLYETDDGKHQMDLTVNLDGSPFYTYKGTDGKWHYDRDEGRVPPGPAPLNDPGPDGDQAPPPWVIAEVQALLDAIIAGDRSTMPKPDPNVINPNPDDAGGEEGGGGPGVLPDQGWIAQPPGPDVGGGPGQEPDGPGAELDRDLPVKGLPKDIDPLPPGGERDHQE